MASFRLLILPILLTKYLLSYPSIGSHSSFGRSAIVSIEIILSFIV